MLLIIRPTHCLESVQLIVFVVEICAVVLLLLRSGAAVCDRLRVVTEVELVLQRL